MEPLPRHRSSAVSISTVKASKWIHRLTSFFPSNNTRNSAAPEPLFSPSSQRDDYGAACAWFLGPKAENADFLKMYVDTILNDVVQCRRNFHREDEDFVDPRIASSPAFKKSMSIFGTNLTFLSRLLPQHSVPFYSPRYMAHMVNDVSMPSTLGYLMGLMYNPNNISPEAGPLSHIIEYDVGQQLCNMLGYNAQLGAVPPLEGPMAWGHMTCGGSIANMESMWVARNLKFYPLALKRATEDEPCLARVATHFKLRLCTEEEKFLAECETWDLLNLTPDEVVSLLTRVAETFGFSLPALQAMLNSYLIQTTGKDEIEKYFGILHSPQYICPTTAHYSWPKSAGVTGIGSKNIISVPVDEQARMDCQALDVLLEESVKRRRAVYAVVVIMGTTEHGSVDPLSKVLALRQKYQKRGLSFLIHVDAAWGGYFASMLVPNPAISSFESSHNDPALFLNPYVENELRHLRFADSVTVDPHKSGYTPFPAGALCYRDGRLRFMVTCKSPVTGLEDPMVAMELGAYGLEGSKPGAAPLAAWLGHEVIGLHKGGYGFLLGQSVFTSTKMYGHWVTMSLDHPNLLVVPFRMLPSEMDPDASVKKVEEERRLIRDTILKHTQEELAKDPEAYALMRQMGSDLVVNSFACNFRVDGVINQDVSEANSLNSRIYDRLSFKKMTENLGSRKVIIMSSVFSQKKYGACLTKFKERLGLRGQEDLVILVNVSMSPFISLSNFEQVLADAFREVAEEEVEVSVVRNRSLSAQRAFIIQGSGPVSLVHMPCFGVASQRQQCILSGELSDSGLKAYREAKRTDPNSAYLACTLEREELPTIIRRKSFKCSITKLASDGASAIVEAEVTNIRVVKNRSLCSRHFDIAYPSRMPFYLYGTGQEMHIDHILVKAPNAQVSAGEVTVELIEGSESAFAAGLKDGLIGVADTFPEHLMQPFTSDCLKSFFHRGAKLDLTIYPDNCDKEVSQSQGYDLCGKLDNPVARARITLGGNTFVDAHMINLDVPVVLSQLPNSGMPGSFPEATSTSQDHPFVRGYAPGGRTDCQSSTTSAQGWREVWDRALAGRQFTDVDSNPASELQTQDMMPRHWKHRVPSSVALISKATDALVDGMKSERHL